jgi:hypothetical protein
MKKVILNKSKLDINLDINVLKYLNLPYGK